MTDLHDRRFADLVEGEALRPLNILVSQQHIDVFQDFLGHLDASDPDKAWLLGNNLHVDEEYSKRNMYGGKVGDGNQTVQYCCQVVTDSLPWGTLVSGYSKVDVKLTNPTRPGDEVVVTGSVARKFTDGGRDFVDCEVKAVKQGDVVVATGTIRAYVPR
jgi:hypothetical protein